MKKLGLAGFATALFLVLNIGISHAMTIADSQSEFSRTQGENNWYYGYFSTAADSSSFVSMLYFSDNTWSEATSYPPYTILWSHGGHPNGAPYGTEHWSVRRWVSGVDGIVTISGSMADSQYNTNGDGIIARIYVDGSEVYSKQIQEGDTDGFDYSFDTAVTAGSYVDFAIDPNSNISGDSTLFTATISAVPIPGAIWMLGSCFLGLAGLRITSRFIPPRRSRLQGRSTGRYLRMGSLLRA